jgi:SHS2 domain-containing protein
MLKLFKLIFLLLIVCVSNAQTHHFIYIESQNRKPFTIKVNGIAFVTDHKHFINISKLENGVYNVVISNETAKENKFTISLDGEDLGYTLKQDANNDWVLFDINRFTSIEQDGKATPIIKQDVIVKQDTLTLMPSQKIVEHKEEIKPDTKTIDQKVRKIFNKRSNTGIDQIYVDVSGEKVDTIAIFIPFYVLPTKDTIKQDKTEPVKEQIIQSKHIDLVTKNCLVIATEKDVVDFSAKLQTAPVLKNKLKVAGVLLKDKCYSVNQIKRLSILMINDSGKLNLFKLAQKSVSDANNFASLEKEIKDDILKQEFMALINSQ